MKYLLAIILSTLHFYGFSQKLYQTKYLKFDQRELSNPDSADFIRYIYYPSDTSKNYGLVEKFKNRNLRKEGEILERLTPFVSFEGLVKNYFISGKLQSTLNFHQGQLNGPAIFYTLNGKIEQEGYYHFKHGDAIYEAKKAFDEKGNNLLDDNGNGKIELKKNTVLIKGFYKNGYKDGLWTIENKYTRDIIEENYKNGRFYGGEIKDVNGNKTTYKELFNYPYCEGQSFMKSSGDGVCTPATSLVRSSDHDGLVMISFDIDRIGHARNFKLLTTVSERADQKALELVSRKKWYPASIKGRAYDTYGFIYFVQFNLD